MKKTIKSICVLAAISVAMYSCKEADYVKSVPSPYISNFDLRKLYKGTDVNLTTEVMRAATTVRGQVISDHSGRNLPAGLLMIQNMRTVGNGIDSIRGISVNIGTDAANFIPGDSVHIDIQGGVLKRVDGILQITNVTSSKIQKVATGRPLINEKIGSLNVKSNPDAYEARLVTIFSCNYDPNIGVEKLEGVKTFNDGGEDMQSNVSSSAVFKDEFLPYSANITGVLLRGANSKMNIFPRVKADFVPTSITVDASIPLGPTPVVVTGFCADVQGGDGNYEYAQFMATQDLDFRQKPFAVIFGRNGGNLSPDPNSAPVDGWAAGGDRTYKFNLTRGTVAKGTYFYVGGNKNINAGNSTSIANANWIANKLYVTEPGDDGIGNPTSGMMPNSGHPAAVAVFATKDVTRDTAPVDVIFYGTSTSAANVYKAASGGVPAYGLLIPNNDHYTKSNGATPYYKQGTNSYRLLYESPTVDMPQGTFIKLGGEYNVNTNTWSVKRGFTVVKMNATTTLPEIETGAGIFKLIQ